MLISEDEARITVELEDMFVVQPDRGPVVRHDWQEQGTPLPDGFRYASDTNPQWLTLEQIREMVARSRMAHRTEDECDRVHRMSLDTHAHPDHRSQRPARA